MPGGKEAFERKLEALAALRVVAARSSGVEPLRKALKDRSNYLVSKAAALAGELRLTALIPDLLHAFDRFMIDPAKTDPQCWAKNAIVKALKDLNHDDPQCSCAALSMCRWSRSGEGASTRRSLSAARARWRWSRARWIARPFSRAWSDLLVDEPPVRSDAIRALGQVPGPDTRLAAAPESAARR